jgi:FAD/FMN-containing dehydrogenase
VHDAYPPATWNRLAAVKRRYDPTNFFDGNHNIAPADAEDELVGQSAPH